MKKVNVRSFKKNLANARLRNISLIDDTVESVPSAVLGVIADPGDTIIIVTWDALEANPEVTSYSVRYRTSPAGPWLPDDDGADVGLVLTNQLNGLTNGVTYDVQVSANNAKGQGDWSSIVSATPVAVPAQVTGLIVAVGAADNSLDISWGAVVAAPAVTSYTYEYKVSSGDTWIPVNVGLDLLDTISGLTSGTSYDVRVFATNAVGNGPYSVIVANIPEGVPEQIQTFSATNGQIERSELSWLIPTSSPAATSVNIEYKLNSSGTWINFPGVLPASNAQSINNLQTVALWDFRIRYVNSKGNGAWSPTRQATPILIGSSMLLELNEKGNNFPTTPVAVANTGTSGSSRDFGVQVGGGSALTHQVKKGKRCWQSSGQRALRATTLPQGQTGHPGTMFWVGIPFFLDTQNRLVWTSSFGLSDSSASTSRTSFYAGSGTADGIPMDTTGVEWLIVYTINQGGSNLRMIKNDGSTDVQGSNNFPGTNNLAPEILCWNDSQTGSRDLSAQVFEFDWYNGLLSASEISSRVEALKQKWFAGYVG